MLEYQRKSLILSVFEHSLDEDKGENEVSISEDDETFVVRVYDYHGKSKRTFFDSGKDLTAKQSDV